MNAVDLLAQLRNTSHEDDARALPRLSSATPQEVLLGPAELLPSCVLTLTTGHG